MLDDRWGLGILAGSDDGINKITAHRYNIKCRECPDNYKGGLRNVLCNGQRVGYTHWHDSNVTHLVIASRQSF
jgi:hypothetical protein